MQPRIVACCAPRLPSLLAALAMTTSMLAEPCMARPHDLGASLVRCTSLRQPERSGHHPASDRVRARYFAPTRQAVFFSHAGDRCAWHPGPHSRS